MLAFGDAVARGPMAAQVYKRRLAVAEDDRLLQVTGFDIGRRGVMRAASVLWTAPWTEVASYSNDEYEDRPALVLTLTRAATARTGLAWVVVVQNVEAWETALTRVGVAKE